MLIIERHKRLMEILSQRKTAQLDWLAEALGVSVSTIRRDLEALERKGRVKRTHGGVVFVEPGDRPEGRMVAALGSRMDEHAAEKQQIGRAAAGLVQPHMTVLLDGGSTVIYAARQMTARPLQVVTSSLAIAHLFAEDDQVELTLLGGQLYPRTGVVVGSITRSCLEGLYADLCLFSLAAMDEQACYNINVEMAQTEQLMLRQADQPVLLMDSSKFGRKSLVRVCTPADLSCIITDSKVESAWKQKLGRRLVIADR